jgi:hypothetical protein
MVYKILPLAMVAFLSFAFNPKTADSAKQTHKIDPPLLASNSKSALEAKVTSVYNGLHAQPNFTAIESFSQALKGFYDLKEKDWLKKTF